MSNKAEAFRKEQRENLVEKKNDEKEKEPTREERLLQSLKSAQDNIRNSGRAR